MTTSVDLILALKSELKLAGLTYADLAARLGLAESSVKRMFSRSGDLPLSRACSGWSSPIWRARWSTASRWSSN